MRSGFPFRTIFLAAGLLTVFAGCSGDDTPSVTDLISTDYQLTGYISNEPFQILDLVMPADSFLLAVNRMKETAIPANLAQVTLNGAAVPIRSFPLNTPEQAIYSLENIAVGPGKNYELLVTIGSGFAESTFQVPSTLYDVTITAAGGVVPDPTDPNDPAVIWEDYYVPTLPIQIQWTYSGGTPSLVDVKAVDNFTGGIPALDTPLDYRVTLDGTDTYHTLSPAVTQYFSNDVRVWVTIQDNVTWGVEGNITLFPGSTVHFVNPYDSRILDEACMDMDGDGYGNPATGICTYRLLDCDDNDPSVNPGAQEGPVGTITCLDGLDNNCNGLTDANDPNCQVAPPGGG